MHQPGKLLRNHLQVPWGGGKCLSWSPIAATLKGTMGSSRSFPFSLEATITNYK